MSVRPVRVVHQVHTSRISILLPDEIRAAIRRHPVPAGHVQVTTVDCVNEPEQARLITPRTRDFLPAIPFEAFATIKRSKWIHRVEVAEVEPEDLTYLRSALLIAGEIGAMTGGHIFDVLAYKTTTPEEIADQIDNAFSPLAHISVHVEAGQHPFWVHTHGMTKFAHPDFELHGVPRESVAVAVQLLKHLVAAVVSGGRYRPGEATQLSGFGFEFQKGPAGSQDHYSDEALWLTSFRLLGEAGSPAMEGMLALPER